MRCIIEKCNNLAQIKFNKLQYSFHEMGRKQAATSARRIIIYYPSTTPRTKKSTPNRRAFTSPINRASLRASCQVAKTNVQMENETRRGFDCSIPPVDRYSRVFSKTNTRCCARLAVGRGKFNLTGAMREHGRTNKERTGHVRKRCFTRAAFRVQTIIKRVVCARVYIRCDRKIRASFLVNCLFESYNAIYDEFEFETGFANIHE